jgi:hypothetical protein
MLHRLAKTRVKVVLDDISFCPVTVAQTQDDHSSNARTRIVKWKPYVQKFLVCSKGSGVRPTTSDDHQTIEHHLSELLPEVLQRCALPKTQT